MATDVDIVNSALIKLGADRISSLSDPTKRAILANEQYVKVRNAFLARFPWHFAKKRATLAADATAPAFGYSTRFKLPTDCLKVLRTQDDEYNNGNSNDWVTEGGYLLTNSTTCGIIYIYLCTDYTLFPPLFCEALALQISADLCYALTQNASLQKNLYDAAEAKLSEARSLDSQETGKVDVPQASTWLNSRY